MKENIAAISTALGVGAISIVRVSGEDAISIANRIFSDDLLPKPSHTITHGYITEKNELIDEVLVTVMRAPKTYTGENIVEINCHGGISSTNRVLEALLNNGARLAEPGEFTKRAFLNGKIDLEQAEGIMDLIESKTEKSRKIALDRISGKVSSMISDLRDKLVAILANIEVNIDYPEYEDQLLYTNELLKENMKEFKNRIEEILKETKESKVIKEGINVVIIGKPNVGKSSLLNWLIDENKAIVTNIPGTTRDIVEGTCMIEGILINITDTAGIRKTDDIIEELGVNKSLELIDAADLILLMFDNSVALTEEDKQLLDKTKTKNRVILLNKIDITTNIDTSSLPEFIKVSVQDKIGMSDIKTKVIDIFKLKEIMMRDFTYVANAREISLLKETQDIIEGIIISIENNLPIDMVEIDVKKIWEILGEITGEIYSDELIDQLFSRFCLGK